MHVFVIVEESIELLTYLEPTNKNKNMFTYNYTGTVQFH